MDAIKGEWMMNSVKEGSNDLYTRIGHFLALFSYLKLVF